MKLLVYSGQDICVGQDVSQEIMAGQECLVYSAIIGEEALQDQSPASNYGQIV